MSNESNQPQDPEVENLKYMGEDPTPSIIPPDLESRMTCAICEYIVTDPITLSCFHSFCRSCFVDVDSKKFKIKPANCPTCKEPISLSPTYYVTLKNPIYFDDCLDILAPKVICLHCKGKLNQKDFNNEHVSCKCPEQECEYCFNRFTKRAIKVHEMKCRESGAEIVSSYLELKHSLDVDLAALTALEFLHDKIKSEISHVKRNIQSTENEGLPTLSEKLDKYKAQFVESQFSSQTNDYSYERRKRLKHV